jgi:hypothetical protein
MIAALFLVASVVLLLQFFVSYCRSLIAASVKHELSAEVRDVTGLSTSTSGEDFARVIQLLFLCPDRPEDRSDIRLVSAYFQLMNFLRGTLAPAMPSVQTWIERERSQCTYFAAVTLDRRIAFSRDLLAQQIEA